MDTPVINSHTHNSHTHSHTFTAGMPPPSRCITLSGAFPHPQKGNTLIMALILGVTSECREVSGTFPVTWRSDYTGSGLVPILGVTGPSILSKRRF